jgi:formate hydrogenlyase subunit 4
LHGGIDVSIALHIAILLIFPLPMLGLINVVKSKLAGRSGPPLLQPVYDLLKLLRKGAVYSTTTTVVFVAGPIISLATAVVAGLLVPLGAGPAPLAFAGDVFLFAYLLGLGRFFTMAAALDTGSAFEGMGASREAAFSALAEPALFLCLMTLCVPAGTASLTASMATFIVPGLGHPVLLIAATALSVVLVAEAARIPVDDPNTHLELTMVHEVMVLDHSGPDFAFVLFGYATKLFVLAAVLVRLVVQVPDGWLGIVVLLSGEALVAVLIGVVESAMARLRLPRVPQFLIGASVIAAVGAMMVLGGSR